MAGHRLALGGWGQCQARDYLEGQGYTVLQENFRCPEGEIDIVDHYRGWLVFVDVRTRSTRAVGIPGESLTP